MRPRPVLTVWLSAHVESTSSAWCGSMTTVSAYSLRKLTPTDKSVVASLLVREWGAVEVVALSLGGVVDPSTLPGWLAEADDEVVGLLTYLIRDDVAELVTINAFTGGGVGSALLGALVEECQTKGVRRIQVTTTNDNIPALRFYQRAGFRLTALRIGAVDGRGSSNRRFRHTAWTASRSATRSSSSRNCGSRGGRLGVSVQSPRATRVTSASARAEVQRPAWARTPGTDR